MAAFEVSFNTAACQNRQEVGFKAICLSNRRNGLDKQKYCEDNTTWEQTSIINQPDLVLFNALSAYIQNISNELNIFIKFHPVPNFLML